MARERPAVISTRVFPHDRARIRALAELEGVSVCEALYRLLIPAVHARLTELTGTQPGTTGVDS